MSELKNSRIKVTTGGSLFRVGIKSKGGFGGAMTEMASDHFIAAWVIIEVQLGTDMAEQVQVDR